MEHTLSSNQEFEVTQTRSGMIVLPVGFDTTDWVEFVVIGDQFYKFRNIHTGEIIDCADYAEQYCRMTAEQNEAQRKALEDKALAQLKADLSYGGSLPAGVDAQEARKHGAPLPQNRAASAPQATGEGTGAGMAVKDGRAVPLGKYGCYNRPPYAPGYYAPNGRDNEGHITDGFIPFTMSPDCKTYRPTDERCAGCEHQPTK